MSTNVQNEAVEEYETGHINEESGTEELNNFMQLANIEASSSEGQYAQTEPSSDEKLAELQYAIARQPLLREILYKILQFCRVEANLETLEKEVASFPEYATCRYSAVALANILVKHYGLKLVEHSSDGSVVQEADKKGLSEDEVDDLVAFVSYVTTPEGEVLVEQHEPAFRLAQLLEVDSSYDAFYRELLEYRAATTTSKTISRMSLCRALLSAEIFNPCSQACSLIDSSALALSCGMAAGH